MAKSSSSWEKGQSGNPSGRPKHIRQIANMLITYGMEQDESTDESRFDLIADMIWGTLLSGAISFKSGKTLEIIAREWIDLVKWMAKHVDGSLKPVDPAPADDSSGGNGGGSRDLPLSDWDMDYTMLPDGIDPLLNAPVESPVEHSTDALPQLDSYLSKFSAPDLDPIRPYVKPEVPHQVSNPDLIRELLLKARAQRLAKSKSGGTNASAGFPL